MADAPRPDSTREAVPESLSAASDNDGELRDALRIAVPAPRTPKAAQTQQRLLDAAASVFTELGYEATRIADIAQRADVAHGSFYRYFPDKDAILTELLLRLYAELGAETRSPGSSDDTIDPEVMRRQLEAFNIRFFRGYARRRGLLRVAREAAASNGSGSFRRIWFAMRGRFVDRTCRLITRLQQAGYARGLDPALTAEALGAMSEQLAYVLIGLAEHVPDDEALAAIGRSCNDVWVRTLFPEHTP